MPRALSELHRVLKPDGILFIAVKEGKGEGNVLEREFHGYPRFISCFSEQEVRSYLEESEFQLMDIYRYNERRRFGRKHRDLDFLFSFSQKKQ
jgi:ubiquinone/menaquinone biosynthesis C-methylase UbiE